MDIFLIIVGALLILAGIVGSVLPVMPGLPLSWAGLLLLKFTETAVDELSWTRIIWTGVVVLIITILESALPVLGTRKFGGSKRVVMGASIGLLGGFFLGPLGIVLGPFLGALIGGLIDGNPFNQSTRQAMGAFIGFFAGLVLKMVFGGVLAWFFVEALI
jgi:hypothetical protein